MAKQNNNPLYYEAVGRRKTAIARVRLTKDDHDFVINGKALEKYFPKGELHTISHDAFDAAGLREAAYGVSAKILGGGSHAQAEALRHGIARALLKVNADYRKPLKSTGYLRRDPRAKERRKFGLKKARKAPQWAKR